MESDSEKAKILLNKSHASYHLVEFWLEVRHYPSWSKRDDFDLKWNFGVSDIASGERTVSTRFGPKTLKFVSGNFAGDNFEIVSDKRAPWWPDDDAGSVVTLWFVWNAKQVLVANYITGDDDIIPSHFELFSVEELHWADDWIASLARASGAIEAHGERQTALRKREQEEQERGKFSLPDIHKSVDPAPREFASLEELSHTGRAVVREWDRLAAKPTISITKSEWRFLRDNWRYGLRRYATAGSLVILAFSAFLGMGMLIDKFSGPLLIVGGIALGIVILILVLAIATEAWPLLIALAAIVYLSKNC